MKITELYGVIRLNISSFESGLNAAIRKTDQFRANFSRAASDVAAVADHISVATAAVATAVGAATARMGFSFLQSRDAAEIMLSTILKDSQLAQKALAELFEAAKTTPFSFEGLRDGLVQLANAKVAADQLIPSLLKISDAVAAVGGSDADVKSVAYALSQMMSAGRLTAQDMMQLVNRGIPAWDLLAEKIGATVAEVRKMSESGAIDGRLAAEAIIEGMGERFTGAGAKLSVKFQGVWSSFKDVALQQAGIIIEPIYDALTNLLNQIVENFNRGAYNGLIARLRDFSRQVVEFGSSVIAGIKNHGPALMEVARNWWELLKPVAEFIAKHPSLIAAFGALKAGQILGVNQAIISLTSAFVSLGASITSLASVAIPALAIALGTTLGVKIANMSRDVRELRREVERAQGLDAEIETRREMRQQAIIESARKQSSPEAAREILERELHQSMKNLAGAQASAAGAKKVAGELGDRAWQEGILTWAFSEVRKGADSEAKAEMEKAKKLAAWIKTLREEIDAIDSRHGRIEPAVGEVGAKPGGLAEAIEQKRREAEESARAKEEARLQRELEQRAREAGRAIWEFSDKLFDLRSRVPTAELIAFQDAMQRLTDDFSAGAITQDEFRRHLDALNDSLRTATDAADEQARMNELLQKVPPAAARGFQVQVEQLAARFKNGEINAFEFRRETEKLAKAMDAAAEAAKEQEKAEMAALKRRIVSGQGTREDWIKVFQLQQQAMAEQREKQIEAAFDKIVGLGDTVETVSKSFNNLNLGIQNFGNQLNQVSGGNAQNVSEAWINISAMLNSWEGQIATLRNNIAMMQQALTFADTYPQRKAIQDQIAAMQAQLSEMMRPPPPLFSGESTDDFQSKIRIGTQANEFHLVFPNWNPQNPSEIRFLADAIIEEMARRGRGMF